jgi:hypothetical protein
MKQTLVLLIILTLFSFMAALACSPNLKIVCVKTHIGSCKCAPKNVGGTFAVSHSCNAPQFPVCVGNSKTVNCKCQ